MMDKEIMVSVSCITYNQADYIRDALEGFVMQKTNFAYEVLIHDDASTDGTADIIREYEVRYPDLIKPIYQTENQYSKGVAVADFNSNRAKGKYIALCEGDDYWTDPCKLQKQFDAMERHPEVDMCCHAVKRVKADTGDTVNYYFAWSDKETIITLEQMLMRHGSDVGTCSVFFRKSLYCSKYQFWKKSLNDATFKIFGAVRGGLLYLPDCMAVYRVLSKGSWSVTMQRKENRKKHAKSQMKKMEAIDLLNEETGYRYAEIIKKVRHAKEFRIMEILRDYKGMLSPKYADIRAKSGRFYIEKMWVSDHFPWLVKMKKRIIG